jgi:hypothetical protein
MYYPSICKKVLRKTTQYISAVGVVADTELETARIQIQKLYHLNQLTEFVTIPRVSFTRLLCTRRRASNFRAF